MSRRALLAVGLFAGFYAIGLLLAALLLWLPWAQMRFAGSLDFSGVLGFAGALYVLWALLPPRNKWKAPGPPLTPSGQPRLHALIASVARATRHPLPAAVYLTGSPNAFAASRPRWLGLRREPILGLGLPLFAFFTEDQCKAVLAHEFGHHAGGDVRLGAWQHGTHRAIAAALARLDGSSIFLHLPFYAYGRLFLRLTGAASRQQELQADALAARVTSPRAVGGALVALERHSSSWDEYWHGVFGPAIEAGFLLPLLEGYRVYWNATRAERVTEAAEQPRDPAPDDTHPPLAARLAALQLTETDCFEDLGVSAPILDDPGGAEAGLLATLFIRSGRLAELKRVCWGDWGALVLPAVWETALGPRLKVLDQAPLGSLPELLKDEAATWDRLREGVNVYSPEARRRQARSWLATWASLSLFRAGFRVVSAPGAEPALEGFGVRVRPFCVVEELSAGRSSPEWRAAMGALSASH